MSLRIEEITLVPLLRRWRTSPNETAATRLYRAVVGSTMSRTSLWGKSIWLVPNCSTMAL